MRLLIKTILFLLLSSTAWAASPVIFFSDLLAGPKTGGENNNGVYVTIWGKNFGASQGGSTVTVGGGAVSLIKTWNDGLICFQLGASVATGNIVVTVGGVASNGLAFTVQSGNIYFVDPTQGSNGSGTFASPFNYIYYAENVAPAGSTIYVRASTIAHQTNGHSGWHAMLIPENGGTSGSPVSYIAYPNETVTFQIDGGATTVVNGSASSGDTVQYGLRSYSSWITFAKFNIQGLSTNCGSAMIQTPIDGSGTGYRIVGNDVITPCYTYAEIGTGGSGTGSNNYVLGNTIHGSGTYYGGAVNTNHAIYWSGPADYVEIGWNTMTGNVNSGWEISRYHNGPAIGLIHDNKITPTTAGDDKGILIGGAFDSGDTLSTTYTNSIKVYNNVIVNAGQNSNGGALQVLCGTTYVYNNTIYGSGTETQGQTQYEDASCGPGGGNSVFYVANNIHYGNNSGLYISNGSGSAPTWADFTVLAHNIYYNEGNGPTQDTTAINSDPKFVTNFTDLHIQGTSPGINQGYNTNSVAPTDYDGVTRPSTPDVGAYQYATGGGGGGGSSTGDFWGGSLTIKGVTFK